MDKTMRKNGHNNHQYKNTGIRIRYDNCCTNCWHTWIVDYIPEMCPKCKAVKGIDTKKELLI